MGGGPNIYYATGMWVIGPEHSANPPFGIIIRVGEHNEDITVWTGSSKFDGTEMSLQRGTIRIPVRRNNARILGPLDAMALASRDSGTFHDIPDGWQVCYNNDCMRWTAPGMAVYCSNECAWRDV
jgi:hypothetical protein